MSNLDSDTFTCEGSRCAFLDLIDDAFTDLKQSKILAEILPIESADMHYVKVYFEGKQSDWFIKPVRPVKSDNIIPCWSLTALLKELPDTILGKDKDGYVVMVETMGNGLTAFASNPVDACYEMILKLHELKML